ncbi:MAG: DUF4157 domain-containing protein [Spirochaetales bacterium]|nr:DUF4157 domain-containing protein [Spirochaetales bacterium]
MGSLFGTHFSDVRIHTDNKAGHLTNELNAKAFTIGNHIAFRNKEYKPGTPVGDALIAHELAHTIQQKGAGKKISMKSVSGNISHNAALERDADESTLGVIAKMFGKVKSGFKQIMPRLKTGLTVSRCAQSTLDTFMEEYKKGPGMKHKLLTEFYSREKIIEMLNDFTDEQKEQYQEEYNEILEIINSPHSTMEEFSTFTDEEKARWLHTNYNRLNQIRKSLSEAQKIRYLDDYRRIYNHRWPPDNSVASHARDLINNSDIINSYKKFRSGRSSGWAFFFSYNPNLIGAASKPRSLSNWEHYLGLSSNQKITILQLANPNKSNTEIIALSSRLNRTDSTLQMIISGYNTWPNKMIAVFQNASSNPTNSCNILVGEALALAGYNSVSSEGRYFSAENIYDNVSTKSFLYPIDPLVISPGDIDGTGGHVDVVASVDLDNSQFSKYNGYGLALQHGKK